MSLGRDKPTNQVDSMKNMMTQNMGVKDVSISLDDAPYSDVLRTAMSEVSRSWSHGEDQ